MRIWFLKEEPYPYLQGCRFDLQLLQIIRPESDISTSQPLGASQIKFLVGLCYPGSQGPQTHQCPFHGLPFSMTTWREVQDCTSSQHPSSYKQFKHQHAPLCKEAQQGYRLTRAEKMLTGRKHVSLWKVIHRNKGLSEDTLNWHYHMVYSVSFWTVTHVQRYVVNMEWIKEAATLGLSHCILGFSKKNGWMPIICTTTESLPSIFPLFSFSRIKGDKYKSLSRRQYGLLNGQMLISLIDFRYQYLLIFLLFWCS